MLAKWVRWVLAVSVLALLVACGGGGGDAADDAPAAPAGGATGETIDVSGHEFGFDPASLSAPADTDVTVSFTNAGNIDHDWAIKDHDVKVAASPGQTTTGTFNLPAGEYTFYCTIPGHEAAGMVGTLTVG